KMTSEERRESILKTIDSKRQHYPESIVSNLVLIIDVTIPRLTHADLDGLPRNIDYGFQGIYFVHLPYLMAEPNDTYGNNGYVYCLKSAL
ncbi:hypothetical protein, partial [Staphylococcus nepalensis]|uniref:hypothetical protein n=1 Tax=Staphylococcus nepalensis TaxID=214473 RepID=UPI00286595B2